MLDAVLDPQGGSEHTSPRDLDLMAHVLPQIALDVAQRGGPIRVAAGARPERQVAAEELVGKDLDLLVRDVFDEGAHLVDRAAGRIVGRWGERRAGCGDGSGVTPVGLRVGALGVDGAQCSGHQVVDQAASPLGEGLFGIGRELVERTEVEKVCEDFRHRSSLSQQGAGVWGWTRRSRRLLTLVSSTLGAVHALVKAPAPGLKE